MMITRENKEKALKYLHTVKTRSDPVFNYLLLCERDYFYYYLLMNPDVLGDASIEAKVLTAYRLFLRNNNRVTGNVDVSRDNFKKYALRETTDYYYNGSSGVFNKSLRDKVQNKMVQLYNPLRRDKDIPNTTDSYIRIHQYQQENILETTVKYKSIHESHLQRVQRLFPTEVSTSTTTPVQLGKNTIFNDLMQSASTSVKPSVKYTIEELSVGVEGSVNDKIKSLDIKLPRKKKSKEEILENLKRIEKDEKLKLQRENRQIDKTIENGTKWQQEVMKQDNRSTYKRWVWTPNDATRHTSNDGQIVPLKEKFVIVNDKTGDVDYLMYPGDNDGSPSNTYNCLCELEFDTRIVEDGINLDDVPDYDSVVKDQEALSQSIKDDLVKKKT